MKVFRNSPLPPDRKVMAYIGVNGEGVYLRSFGESCSYIDQRGTVTKQTFSFDKLGLERGRIPIHEGESITLQF